jgi:hypothetical protein
MRVYETLHADERAFLPYLEAGIYLFFNLGGGYTFGVNSPAADLAGPHLFVGLPLPIDEVRGDLFYAEPYYRATYGDAGTLHEAGVFVKWASWY